MRVSNIILVVDFLLVIRNESCPAISSQSKGHTSLCHMLEKWIVLQRGIIQAHLMPPLIF